MLQFTHSFNDNKNSFDTFSGPGFVGHSNETEQNFIVGMGPRFDFLSSDYLVRPYGLFQIEWDHFARFNGRRSPCEAASRHRLRIEWSTG